MNSTLLLTTREAAEQLAVCEKTLWSLTQKGEVRCVRIGRSVRYSRTALQEFIERKESEPITESSQV